MAYGEKYQDYPFADRFGEWPVDERQQGINRLMEEFLKEKMPRAGYDLVDELGHRGQFDPATGFFMLKGI